MEVFIIYFEKELLNKSISILMKVGLERKEAEIASDILVTADKRGIDTHGLSKLPIYIKRIQSGAIDIKAKPEVIKEKKGVAVIDANNCLGQITGYTGAKKAIELAKEHYWSSIFVRNSNHFGIAAYYSMLAAKEGMIGITFSNANPTMPPYGGKKAMLGTNPISVAIPTRLDFPIVLDMATSTVARGKIIMAAKKGNSIPKGWALTENGKKTVSAEEALHGMLTPLGGPKGSALAMVIDIFCGVLSGGHYLTEIGPLFTQLDRGQSVGHFFAALNIEAVISLSEYYSVIESYIKSVKDCPSVEGEQVFLPGELEYLTSQKYISNGIPLNSSVIEELNQTALSLGLDELF